LEAAVAGEVAGFLAAARAAAGDGGAPFAEVEALARAAGRAVANAMAQFGADLVCAGAGPGECGCGRQAPVHSVRSKTVATMTGDVALTRAYCYCRECGEGFCPADRALGLDGRSRSEAVDMAAAAAGREAPFAAAAALIEEIGGVRVVSAKTCDRVVKEVGGRARQIMRADAEAAARATPAERARRWDRAATAYVAYDGTGVAMVPSETEGRKGKGPDGRSHTREDKIARLFTQTGRDKDGQPVMDKDSSSFVTTFEPVGPFSAQVAGEALRRDVSRAPRLAVLGDGAVWIWGMADRLWPRATQIVDFYHAVQHVNELADLLKPHLGGERPKEFAKSLRDLLKQGDITGLAAKARQVAVPEDLKDEVGVKTAYFTKNWHRMQYAKFKAAGYFIGSGAVESACRSVAEDRVSRSGMRWTVEGADRVIALRALHRSSEDRYAKLWTRPANPPALAQAA
jgi:hypothetical protein